MFPKEKLQIKNNNRKTLISKEVENYIDRKEFMNQRCLETKRLLNSNEISMVIKINLNKSMHTPTLTHRCVSL